MPEKHLFVNFSHYQDRPDPNLRHKIASHAARYGPNGSLAFKTSPERALSTSEQTPSLPTSRHSPRSMTSNSTTPMERSASISSMPADSRVRKDYETILAHFDDFCACTEDADKEIIRSMAKAVHSEECSVLDDYITLFSQYELPFRVFDFSQKSAFDPPSGASDNTLVFQCLLVASQAAIDGLDPKFKGKPSKHTLTLQQKALAAMQKVITKRPNTVDDSLVLGSAILMSIAAYFDDQGTYKAHKSSLQKLIDLQGGMNQTKVHRMVKTTSNAAEVCLSMHRYTAMKLSELKGKRQPAASPISFSPPFKLKYPMSPFATEVTNAIERLCPGFQSLAKASKLSVQALQLVGLASKWSLFIDQVVDSEAEAKQLFANTPGANARLFDLFTDSVETQRVASLLLLSLPIDSTHMKLEKCISLGFLNILHSVSLWKYPAPIRDQLAIDFCDAIFPLSPKDSDEEDCVIWLALVVANEWRHCASRLEESAILERHGHDATIQCQLWIQKSKQLMDWIVVKYEKARAWEDLAKLCARFLWLRRLHREWKGIWNDARERRLRNMPRKKSRCSP